MIHASDRVRPSPRVADARYPRRFMLYLTDDGMRDLFDLAAHWQVSKAAAARRAIRAAKVALMQVREP